MRKDTVRITKTTKKKFKKKKPGKLEITHGRIGVSQSHWREWAPAGARGAEHRMTMSRDISCDLLANMVALIPWSNACRKNFACNHGTVDAVSHLWNRWNIRRWCRRKCDHAKRVGKSWKRYKEGIYTLSCHRSDALCQDWAWCPWTLQWSFYSCIIFGDVQLCRFNNFFPDVFKTGILFFFRVGIDLVSVQERRKHCSKDLMQATRTLLLWHLQ